MGIYDTCLQLLAYAGPTKKCQLAPGESDTLRFNTINKKKVLKQGESYCACLLYNTANSSTDQIVKADKGLQNLLRFSVVPADYGTADTKNNNIHPYPNPTTDRIQLDLSHAAEIQLFNMEGKLMYQASFPEGKIIIDCCSYPKGTYIIRILEADGRQHTFKAVVQ